MKQALMTISAVFILMMPITSIAGDCGDVDNSGAINILDVTFLINYLYKGGPAPDPLDMADVNNDDVINILDITYLIGFLYLGGPEPDCGPITGTIVIDPSPDSINAPWSLSGPGGYNSSGNGDLTLTDLDIGDYTITWEDVAGWIAPSEEMQTLTAGEMVTFSGTYAEEPTTGTIVIDSEPDALNAPWSLSGPGGYNSSGNGDLTLTDLDIGDYTITWENVSGWFLPPGETQALAAGGTVTFSGTYTEAPDSTGTVTDIDGNMYQTIKIGDQWWMADNLKVTHYRNGDPIPHVIDGNIWPLLTTGAYCEFDNDSSYVATYGRLYNWYAVDDSRNIAPDGWHVPTDNEWKQLEMYLGMSQAEADAINWRGTDEGGKLKESGTTHWANPNTGATNESGFTALPGGYRSLDGGYGGLGGDALFWSYTAFPPDTAYAWERSLSLFLAEVYRYYSNKQLGMSIRCVRDYAPDSTGTVTDIDGNIYQTIKIGDQWWMMENLKVTHYRNGDPIPHVTDQDTWEGLTTGAYCEYDNDPGNMATYGRLYNWYAVDDSCNIAPAGWHVPTDSEWKQLEIYLGMSQTEADVSGWRGTDEGGKLKEVGTTHWASPNTGATNESGFTALPGGCRLGNGFYINMGDYASFWSSTEYSGYYAWYRYLSNLDSQVYRHYYNKRRGYSIRCVRD